MNTADPDSDADVTVRFERELDRLIAESFARGATIERTWEFASPATDAPNWVVRIERTYSDDDPPYEPHLLEE